MWRGDECQEINVSYTPTAGHFGTSYDRSRKSKTRVEEWEGCREIFHDVSDRRRFYFAHDLPEGRGRSISVFFDKVEDKLKLPEDQRARFGPTSKRKIIWVEQGKWWRGHSMRRSFFTALLRCARAYRIHEDNFEHALYGLHYTRQTKDAVKRFFEGNTWYWGRVKGWWNAFAADGDGNWQARREARLGIASSDKSTPTASLLRAEPPPWSKKQPKKKAGKKKK